MFVSTKPDTKVKRLSAEHESTIKATLPAVGENINEIATTFYAKMFTAHPELLNNTFNRANQKSGEQQKALAASVATFATQLVDPEAPDPVNMLSRISHKHVSLGIVESDYQVVHDNLMAGIAEVLGDAVTDDVADAWSTVYWIMAGVLVDQENVLYASDGVEPGDVFRDVEVTEKEKLSANVTLFTLEGDLTQPRPGQYSSLGIKLPDGARQLRQYSIIKGEPGRYTIAVETEGEVSNHLENEISVGDTIQATLAAGDLVLEEGENPVVLVSSGIGSTPMIGMLSNLARRGSERKVTHLHADDSEETFAQREQGRALVAKLGNATAQASYRNEGKRLNVAEHDMAGADVYICGGNVFLQSVRGALLELPQDQAPAEIRYELFSPNDWLVN